MGLYLLWLLSFFLKLVGAAWDASWHFKYLRDSFAPPHDVNIVGFVLGCLLVIYMWRRRKQFDANALFYLITAYCIYFAAMPLDEAYHRAFGLDLTTWSPTHFLLYIGTGLMIWSVLLAFRRGLPAGISQRARTLVLLAFCFFLFEDLLFPLGQQEYGAPGLAAIIAGHPIAAPELLQFVKDPFHTAFGGIPFWIYPVYMFAAAAFGMQVTRRVTRLPWGATAVTVIYLAYRALAAFIFHTIAFPVSYIPYFIVALAVVVDLLADRQAAGHLAAAVLGTGAALTWALLQQRSGTIMPTIQVTAVPFAMLTAYIGLHLADWVSAEVVTLPTQADVRARVAAVWERLRHFAA